MKILLTGATGFIGRRLLNAASCDDFGKAQNWVACDRTDKGDDLLQTPQNTLFTTADLQVVGACVDLVKAHAPDAIVHLAGITAKGESPESVATLIGGNFLPTQWLLAALGEQKQPCHFVLASTGLVYGDQDGPFREDMELKPRDSYAWSKYLAELAVTQLGNLAPQHRTTIVRPSVIYGPGQNPTMLIPSLVQALQKGERLSMTPGEQYRDFLHADDLARALLAILQQQTEGVFNIASGYRIRIANLAHLAADIAGKPELLGLGDLPYRAQESWEYSLDNSRFRNRTHWQPQVELADGLRQLIQCPQPPAREN